MAKKATNNDRMNPRTALIPRTQVNRERGLSGPPTAQQRVNNAKAMVNGETSVWRGLRGLTGL